MADRWPSTPAAQIALRRAAAMVIEQGDYQKAVALYKRLLATDPAQSDRAEAIYRLGWALRDAGLPQQAKAQFEVLHADHVESTYWSDATYRLANYAASPG